MAALVAVVLLYSAVTGGIATVWAKHIANKALRGIASVISEIDKAEEKNDAYEKAIAELARQAQELQQKVDEQDAEQERLLAELVKAHGRADRADEERERIRREAAARPKIESLEQARDVLNRVLGHK